MSCNNFQSLQGCNNCKFSLVNPTIIPLLTASSMIDILDQIMEQFTIFPSSKILIDDTTISCTGDICLVYYDDKTMNSAKYNKVVSHLLISTWLNKNIESIYESLNTLYLIICACLLSYDETEQKIYTVLESFQLISSLYIFVCK